MKFIVLLLLIMSCGEKPISTSQTNNPNFQVSFLFENEGCRVYRFEDYGYARYYTNCSEVTWSESYQCGKSRCSRPISNPTGKR